MNPILQRLLLASALLWGLPLAAQVPAPPACPGAEDIEPLHLYGLWQLRLWPEGGNEEQSVSSGVLLFEKHPDYPGSVRGELRRSGAGTDLLARVSGDVTDGVFNLDESADGVSMTAVWTGDPQDCGRRIRGVRRPVEGSPTGENTLQFDLRKPSGWR